MAIHLALVGSDTFVSTVMRAVSFDDVRFSPFIYHHPKEAATIAQQLGSFDAVFFSGSFPYAYALPYLKETLAHHVVQDETVLLTTLLHASVTQHVPLDRLTMDVNDPERLASIFASLPDMARPNVMKIDPDVSFTDVFTFHASKQPHDASLAVTSIERVHHELLDAGYNSQLMIEPIRTIVVHVEKLIERVRHAQADAAQFAVVLYASTTPGLQTYLAALPHHGHVEVHSDTTSLLTTKGVIERALQIETLAPSDEETKIGIGYGPDYQTAHDHATIAISASTHHPIRIIDASKKLSFPGTDETIAYRVTEDRAFDLMKRLGISPANVSKIIGFAKQTHEFTAKEMTAYLHVSRRTTERLIKKLFDAGYVEVIGEEMSYAQGRPRSVYKFKLPT